MAKRRRASVAGRRGRGRLAGAMVGGESNVGGVGGARHGVLATARDVARNFGGSTVETARQFASTAKDAATGVASRTQETVVQAAGKVRDHPWPALLIGAGVTWLAVDAVSGRSRPRRRRKAESSGPGLLGRTASTIAGAGRGAGGFVGDFVRERPLLAGAATLGVGMAVGMAMPSTSAENRLMGNVREGVVRRARKAAKGTLDAVRDVAEGVEKMAGGVRERTR